MGQGFPTQNKQEREYIYTQSFQVIKIKILVNTSRAQLLLVSMQYIRCETAWKHAPLPGSKSSPPSSHGRVQFVNLFISFQVAGQHYLYVEFWARGRWTREQLCSKKQFFFKRNNEAFLKRVKINSISVDFILPFIYFKLSWMGRIARYVAPSNCTSGILNMLPCVFTFCHL